MQIVLFLSLILLFSFCSGEDASTYIENQFQTIRDVLASGTLADRKYLVYSLPEMTGKWEEIFGIGNYVIKSAQKEKNGNKIFGAVDFFLPNKKIRAFTYVTLIPEPRSKSGWTISITADQCKKPNELFRKRRGSYADDDCAWWGCIDG